MWGGGGTDLIVGGGGKDGSTVASAPDEMAEGTAKTSCVENAGALVVEMTAKARTRAAPLWRDVLAANVENLARPRTPTTTPRQ